MKPPEAAKPAAPIPAVKPAAPIPAVKPAAPIPAVKPPEAAKPAPIPAKPAAIPERADITALDLRTLFANPTMFTSQAAWQAAGFNVIAGNHDKEIMVSSHTSARGVLFKKFTTAVSMNDQLRNYQLRMNGAHKLQAFLAEKRLQRIVVPQKWIRELPSGGHILVVEHVNVMTRRETQEAYRDVDDGTLRELCIVAHTFRGLDSGARNMLLTTDGKIAFIDTERWEEKRERSGLKHIRAYLTDKQRKRVKKIFQQLDEA